MTDKQLRKLRRSDLIDIIYRLRLENTSLEKKIEALEEELADRKITLEQAGSIAEAAIMINGVLEAAQKAADQYLFSLQALHEKNDEKNPIPNREGQN